jgi:hypothetical protein
MKLTELNPQFVRREIRDSAVFQVPVDLITEAQGVRFKCPKCFIANGGSQGVHQVVCWNPTVPAEALPGPGRWNLEGTGYHDLSLTASSSSVHLLSGCAWHGFVKNGEVFDA